MQLHVAVFATDRKEALALLHRAEAANSHKGGGAFTLGSEVIDVFERAAKWYA